jgi:hypothetical protein
VTARELAVLVICGVIGWALVSWLFALIRQQRAPPVSMSMPLAPPALPGPSRSTGLDIARSWHQILDVSEHATAEEIDRACHARLAECDRVRCTAAPGTAVRREAEARRALISAAYEFIRPQRMS